MGHKGPVLESDLLRRKQSADLNSYLITQQLVGSLGFHCGFSFPLIAFKELVTVEKG